MESEAMLHNTLMGYLDSKCIKCEATVNTEIDDFTLYQVKQGQRYLYCDNCDSPSKPLITQADLDWHKEQTESCRKNYKNMERFYILTTICLFIVGGFIGNFL